MACGRGGSRRCAVVVEVTQPSCHPRVECPLAGGDHGTRRDNPAAGRDRRGDPGRGDHIGRGRARGAARPRPAMGHHGGQSVPAGPRSDRSDDRVPYRPVRDGVDERAGGLRVQRRNGVLPDRHQPGHLGRAGDRARLLGAVRRRGSVDGAVVGLVRFRRDRRGDHHPHRQRRRPRHRTVGRVELSDHAEPGARPGRPEPPVGARPFRGRGRGNARGGKAARAQGRGRFSRPAHRWATCRWPRTRCRRW